MDNTIKQLKAGALRDLNITIRQFKKNPCATNYTAMTVAMLKYQDIVKNYGTN